MAEQSLTGPVYEPTPLPAPLGGIVLDKPADQLQDHQLASASNMVVRDGIVQQRQGYTAAVGTGALSSVSHPFQLYEWTPFDGSARLVVSGFVSLAYYDATAATPAWVDIGGTARNGTISNPVFFTPMRTASSGLRLITVNGVDPPAWWSGSTSSTFVYLTTAVIGACADVWRSHYIQGDVTTSADGHVSARMQWSAIGDPTTWSGTASVGTLDLLDANASKIQLFMAMRGTELAYKEEGVHAIAYKGSPFYFTQSLIHAHLTCISRRAVAPVFNGDQHLVVTKENIILWDGQNIDRIGDPIRKSFYDNLNWDEREQIWATYSPLTEEVFIGVPTGVDTVPTVIWVFNLRHGSWWYVPIRNMLHFYVASSVFNPPQLLATDRGADKVWKMFLGATDDGAVISSSMQWKLFDFGRAGYQKAVKRVTVVLDTGTGATSTVVLQRAIAEQPLALLSFDTGSTMTTTNANKEIVADAKITAKYMSFRLTHTAASETVRIRGLVPWIEPGPKERKTRE